MLGLYDPSEQSKWTRSTMDALTLVTNEIFEFEK